MIGAALGALVWCGCVLGQSPAAGPAEEPALSPNATATAEPPEPPPLWSVPGAPDFGYQTPRAHATQVMTLLNHGSVPVTITQIKGDCACTGVEIVGDKRTLEPSETLDVVISLEVPADTGVQTRQVYVHAEGYPIPLTVPMYVAIGYPIMVNDDPSQGIVVDPIGALRLKSMSKQPFRVLSVNGQAPVLNLFDPAKDPLRDHYEVAYDWGRVPASEYPRWVIIETDHPGAEFFEVPAMVTGYRPIRQVMNWSTVESVILLGRVAGDRDHSTSIHFRGVPLAGGERVRVSSSNPDVLVRIAGGRKPDRGPGTVLDLVVTPAPGLRGFTHAEVFFERDAYKTGVDLFARFVDPGQEAAPGSPAVPGGAAPAGAAAGASTPNSR